MTWYINKVTNGPDSVPEQGTHFVSKAGECNKGSMWNLWLRPFVNFTPTKFLPPSSLFLPFSAFLSPFLLLSLFFSLSLLPFFLPWTQQESGREKYTETWEWNEWEKAGRREERKVEESQRKREANENERGEDWSGMLLLVSLSHPVPQKQWVNREPASSSRRCLFSLCLLNKGLHFLKTKTRPFRWVNKVSD